MRQVNNRCRRSRRGVIDLARELLLYAWLAVFLIGCQGKTPPSPTSISTTSGAESEPSPTIPPASEGTQLFPALTPGIIEPNTPTDQLAGMTDTPYPIPGVFDTPATDSPYPAMDTPVSELLPYPGIQETDSASLLDPQIAATITALAYPSVQETPLGAAPTEEAYPGLPASATTPGQATPTSAVQTPAVEITPIATVVAERVIQPLGTPPESGGTVTIWHAWSSAESAALMQVVSAFQKTYPDIRFDVMALPSSELLTRFEVDAYHGSGPSLLIGPSDWTAYLIDRQLVEDLNPYISPAFSRTIYPAALETGRYRNQLACLPLSQYGVLLYRNLQVLPAPANTFEAMLSQAETATRAGNVGAYLDRGFAFSFAHLYGLGGHLVDDDGNPAFQEQDFRYSLAWVDLLEAFSRPGAYAFNDEKDTSVFKQNRAGYLIDGSWNLSMLKDAIGAQNLAIDPWPTLPQGNLSGYVKAESLYLNLNTAGKSAADHLATLRFMGYLMTVPIQEYLAAQSFIPSLEAAVPPDPLLAQAHAAFARGTAYPAVLLSKDGALRSIYQDTLDAVLLDIFKHDVKPRAAFEKALQDIQLRLEDLK